MGRLSATLFATTIVSLAAVYPSAAASPKEATSDSCAVAKGDAAVSPKARLDTAAAIGGDLIPVYRVDLRHLLPRPELALHRYPRPATTTTPTAPVVALAAKAKVPLGYSDNAKEKPARRSNLPAGLESSVAPVVAGALLTAYA